MRKYLQLAAILSLTAALCGLVPAAAAVAGNRSTERHEMLLRTNGSRHDFGRAHVAIGIVRDDNGTAWVTVFFYG